MNADPGITTKRIRVYGIVQGVGFRPTASRLAHEAGICGTVANKGSYVEIFAQGGEECVDAFLTALRQRPPLRQVPRTHELRK
jgi:hydrogenase maturation protein HypF